MLMLVLSPPGHQMFCLFRCQVDLGTRPQVARREPLSAEDWTRHQDGEGRMINIPQLKQVIFKGVRRVLVPVKSPSMHPAFCHHMLCHVTLQGLCHAVRKDAWKFLLGYFPWDSTLEERKVLQRTKT